MSLSFIWRNFALNSSTHGIQQINSREGRIKKTIWILATTGAVVGLFTNLVIQVEKYFSYPVNVEMTIQHSNDLEFPSITICNMNPVKKSKLQELARKKRSAETARCCCFCCRSNDSSKDENSCSTCETKKCGLQSTENFQSSTTKTIVGTTTATVPLETVTVDSTTHGTGTTTAAESFGREPAKKEEFKKAEQLTEMISRLNLQERIDLGFTLNDLILSCTYAGSNCDPDDFVLVHNPLHGNCFIFNSGWNNRSYLRSFRTGRRYGLLMTLNVNQDEYVFEAGDTAGLRVVIHPGRQMPFPEDEGLIISPGVSTSISMQKVMVERLGGAYSSCFDIDDTPDRSLANVYEEQFSETIYSQEACTRTCYQKHLIESCRCADPQYPRPKGEIVSVCESADEDQVECRRNVSSDFNSELINCDCPVSCKETTYTPTISNGQWPADVAKNEVLKKLENKVKFDIFGKSKFEENIAQVEIFFEDFDYKLISESAAYEITQLLSDVGGIFGLYLGMSFMSLIEHLELLIDLITYLASRFYLHYIRKKKVGIMKSEKMDMENLPRSRQGHRNSHAFREILLRM